MDTNALWQTVLSDLQLQLSKGVFKTFLANSSLASYSEGVATISCTQPLHITYLESRYHDVIKKTLDAYTKSDTTLVFTVKRVEKNEKNVGPLFTQQFVEPMRTIASPAQNTRRLNPDYTFENFAVSSSNQMAYAAATAVVTSPGSSYNPLFLYGGVGVGKTHLMQAIGHQILQAKPKARIIYCTSEEFTNEIIEAIQTKTATSFKKRYRQVDVLLIDDVQFIAGKNTAQEEFFHTFNAIHQNKGQIILTSDKPPEEINKLEDRLRSRFEGGLTIDIGQPDFELRCAILLIKAKHRGAEIPMDVAKLLAQQIDNPRKLEGILVRVLTESQTKKVPITLELGLSILGKSAEDVSNHDHITPDRAFEVVASHFRLKLSQLKGSRRDSALALPRQILYYILRIELHLPLTGIGEFVGGRDHTTVLHGVRKIGDMLSTNDKLREDVMGIKQKLFG